MALTAELAAAEANGKPAGNMPGMAVEAASGGMSIPREPYLMHHLLERSPGADDALAIVDNSANSAGTSYGDLRTMVARLADHLVASGLRRGDRVAILLPKSLPECAAIFAISKAGGVFVPINPVLRAQQVAHIISDCGARILVTNAALGQELGGDLGAIDTLETIVDTDAVFAGEACSLSQVRLDAGLVLGEDLAAILYTSGSTGKPKGVMLSHRNLIAGTRIVRTYLEITSADRILSILPFSFDYGLNQLLTSVEQGATIVLGEFKLGGELVRLLDEHRITGLAGVPAVWALLAHAAPSLAKTPLPHLRYITNSGGAVPAETVKRLRSLLPETKIYLMYGLTEAFRSTFLPPEDVDRKPTSMGRAIPECEVFAVTTDGRRAEPGEQGILVHRGPTVSLGYWNRPEETAKVLRPNPLHPQVLGGDIVCWSGDLVVEDEEGYFHFVARDDAMIKSSGYRISPTEVEEVLMETGSFSQVAVIGVPDRWIGNRVHALAVPATDAVCIPEVLNRVRETLPAYMVPKQIELVDELPTTANGKIDYKKLAAERAG